MCLIKAVLLLTPFKRSVRITSTQILRIFLLTFGDATNVCEVVLLENCNCAEFCRRSKTAERGCEVPGRTPVTRSRPAPCVVRRCRDVMLSVEEDIGRCDPCCLVIG